MLAHRLKIIFYSDESDKEAGFVEKPGKLNCSQNSCLAIDYLLVGASGGLGKSGTALLGSPTVSGVFCPLTIS